MSSHLHQKLNSKFKRVKLRNEKKSEKNISKKKSEKTKPIFRRQRSIFAAFVLQHFFTPFPPSPPTLSLFFSLPLPLPLSRSLSLSFLSLTLLLSFNSPALQYFPSLLFTLSVSYISSTLFLTFSLSLSLFRFRCYLMVCVFQICFKLNPVF